MTTLVNQELPQLLKATDVAQTLNVSRAFAYKLMSKGVLPTVQFLGTKRVRIEDLRRFIQDHISKQVQVGLQ